MFLNEINIKKNSNRHRKYNFFNFKILKTKKKIQISKKIKLNSFFLKKIVNFNNKKFALFSDKNSTLYHPLPYGFLIGLVFLNFKYLNFFLDNRNVLNFYTFNFIKGDILFNLIFKNKTFAKSNGTYILIDRVDFFLKKSLIILPSKKKKFIKWNLFCIKGRNSNIFWKYSVFGSFGFKFKSILKKKINVRGVAMNPVDHPNGGRTKTKQPFKNKYNQIAKHNK